MSSVSDELGEALSLIKKHNLKKSLKIVAKKDLKMQRSKEEISADRKISRIKRVKQEIKNQGLFLIPKELNPLTSKNLTAVPTDGYSPNFAPEYLIAYTECKVMYKSNSHGAKMAAGRGDGVFVSRIDDFLIKSNISGGGYFLNRTRNFDSPFFTQRRARANIIPKDCVMLDSPKKTAMAYFEWLTGTKWLHVQPGRRNWIISQIKNGRLDDKKLLFHADSPFNHAEVLAFIVKYRMYFDFVYSEVDLQKRASYRNECEYIPYFTTVENNKPSNKGIR
ncbi:hypothetical protein ACPF04_06605 [Campylobacter sp. MOP51]|uniref:hypothetical protein n=1 Tax=Campylobacter canis TaxID=3378588 RepID=UPI003C462A2E